MHDQTKYPNFFEMILERIYNLEQLLTQHMNQQNAKVTVEADEKTLLNVQQAASFLSVSTSTIYMLSSQKQIPHMKKGKRLYFTKENLLKWIEETGQHNSSQELRNQQSLQQYLKPRKKKLGS